MMLVWIAVSIAYTTVVYAALLDEVLVRVLGLKYAHCKDTI